MNDSEFIEIQTRSLRERVDYLQQKLQYWGYWYYDQAKPAVSDAVYDAHYRELQNLEQKLQEIEYGSVTQIVGYLPQNDKFQKIQHNQKMLSLENAFGDEELSIWVERLYKEYSSEEVHFVSELKIDGVSLSLIYNQGRLERAVTRGNGIIGEDVTHNALVIKNIPHVIDYEGDLEVRGEVFMKYSDFDKLEGFANPRNATSGTIRLLDSSVASSRSLNFMAYDAIGLQEDSHFQKLSRLSEFGFPVSPYNQLCINLEELLSYCRKWNEERHNLDYPTDGIVIKVDSLQTQEELGTTAKCPRWAIAYKFQSEVAETQVQRVVFEVGRTGAVTPVADLLPVQLAGTVVKRASLHNYDQILRLGLRIGDFVQVHKAGEIIPEILEVVSSDSSSEVINMPQSCPSCGSELVQLEKEVAIKCLNSLECPAQIQKRIEHWVNALEIRGLGEKIVYKLLQVQLVSNVVDLYDVTYEQLLLLDGFKEKSAQNLYSSIQNSRQQSLDKILWGLGIKNIGLTTSQLLLKHIHSLEALLNLTENDIQALAEVDGIGILMAQEVYSFCTQAVNRDLIKGLSERLIPHAVEKTQVSDKLQNLRFVITGSFDLPRKDIEQMISERGAKLSNSVSKKIDYVLAGDDPGSKLQKAQNLGLAILTWESFEKLL